MNKKDLAFTNEAKKLADMTFGYMRLYCMEHGLKKEHIVHAMARLCVEMRDTYPDGKPAFDSLAGVAQEAYERANKPVTGDDDA